MPSQYPQSRPYELAWQSVLAVLSAAERARLERAMSTGAAESGELQTLARAVVGVLDELDRRFEQLALFDGDALSEPEEGARGQVLLFPPARRLAGRERTTRAAHTAARRRMTVLVDAAAELLGGVSDAERRALEQRYVEAAHAALAARSEPRTLLTQMVALVRRRRATGWQC